MNFELIKRLMECASDIDHLFRVDVSDLFSYPPNISPGKQNIVCVMDVNTSENES